MEKFHLNNKVIFGEGNIVCPNSVFTDDIKIGDFNIFNINVTVGHDVKIDSFNTFNSHCDITGGSLVKNKKGNEHGNIWNKSTPIRLSANIK